MVKIALICEHGASTGLCVQKMRTAAEEMGIEAEIGAYSFTIMDSLAKEMDALLLGPQLSFRLDKFKANYPDAVHKMSVISPMDFGMMDGAKILKDALKLIDQNSVATG